METTERKKERGLLFGLVGLIAIIVLLALIGFFFLKPQPQILQGQVEAEQIRVSGKLPGRVADFWVEEGDRVRKGDTLVHIHSSLVEAKMMQASAMETVAKAQNKKVDAGTRIELLNAAYDMWQQAVAGLEIARKTNDRMQSLYKKGVVSAQKCDEAEAMYKSAVAVESAARSQYEMAKRGAQSEDKEASEALVTVAKGSVAEVESMLDDSYLVAPHDGEISEIFPHVGELVTPGAPIMNVLVLEKAWVTFNVREDLLSDLPMGKRLQVSVPALGGKEVEVEIYYIKDMGSYAVWRATKTTGQYDAKTFQVKARPIAPVEGLRPGMSVLLKENKR